MTMMTVCAICLKRVLFSNWIQDFFSETKRDHLAMNCLLESYSSKMFISVACKNKLRININANWTLTIVQHI